MECLSPLPGKLNSGEETKNHFDCLAVFVAGCLVKDLYLVKCLQDTIQPLLTFTFMPLGGLCACMRIIMHASVAHLNKAARGFAMTQLHHSKQALSEQSHTQ